MDVQSAGKVRICLNVSYKHFSPVLAAEVLTASLNTERSYCTIPVTHTSKQFLASFCSQTKSMLL